MIDRDGFLTLFALLALLTAPSARVAGQEPAPAPEPPPEVVGLLYFSAWRIEKEFVVDLSPSRLEHRWASRRTIGSTRRNARSWEPGWPSSWLTGVH